MKSAADRCSPVVAAAVILCESDDRENDDPARRIRGLRDSKLISAEKREELALLIRERAVAWAIAAVDSARIDQINIYQASRVAMLHAVQQLAPAANHLLIDAVRLDCEIPQQPIIHGDALSRSIAAASIIAKVERDRMISAWIPFFPCTASPRTKDIARRAISPLCASTAPRHCIGSRFRPCGTRRSRRKF